MRSLILPLQINTKARELFEAASVPPWLVGPMLVLEILKEFDLRIVESFARTLIPIIDLFIFLGWICSKSIAPTLRVVRG